MADNDFSMGYALGSDSNNNSGGLMGGDGLWAFLLFALIFGNGNFGGFGGGGQGLTRAELYDGFAIQNIDAAVRNVQNGIADSTYALNNAITGGFNGVGNAICSLGYNVQGGFNTLGHQISDCCCGTQRLMERGFCDIGNAINMQTRDLIDNQNANYRSLMDFMVNSKIESLQSENANLRLKASQSDQNAVIRAAIDASTAEIIRRTGNDCPTPAYWVNPPTAVPVPAQGCCGC